MTEIINVASEVLGISANEIQEHSREIPEIDAYYFWSPARGGLAVIIKSDGEKLAATSSISYEEHLKAFIDGRRN